MLPKPGIIKINIINKNAQKTIAKTFSIVRVITTAHFFLRLGIVILVAKTIDTKEVQITRKITISARTNGSIKDFGQ